MSLLEWRPALPARLGRDTTPNEVISSGVQPVKTMTHHKVDLADTFREDRALPGRLRLTCEQNGGFCGAIVHLPKPTTLTNSSAAIASATAPEIAPHRAQRFTGHCINAAAATSAIAMGMLVKCIVVLAHNMINNAIRKRRLRSSHLSQGMPTPAL